MNSLIKINIRKKQNNLNITFIGQIKLFVRFSDHDM
jgi:hypothetical protein